MKKIYAPIGTESRVHFYRRQQQTEPSVTPLKNGSYVVAWETTDVWGTRPIDIRARVYEEGGKWAGPELSIGSRSIEAQWAPSVASLSNGNWIASWSAWEDDDWQAVMGQIFSPTGRRIGKTFQISEGQDRWQGYNEVTGLADGGFAVTWRDKDKEGKDNKDILIRTYDAQGDPLSRPTKISFPGLDDETRPDIASLTGGGYVVVWEAGTHAIRFDNTMYATIVGANGKVKTPKIVVNDADETAPAVGAVTGLDDGGFVVVWRANTTGRRYSEEIVGQRFDSDGQKIGDNFLVTRKGGTQNSEPDIVSLPDGGVAVTWERFGTGKVHGAKDDNQDIPVDVFSQRFDADMKKVGGEVRLNKFATGAQDNAVLAVLQNGKTVAVWESYKKPGEEVGNEVVQVHFRARHVGTNRADDIEGTADKDTILGRNGDDTIKAGSGRDFIDGGNGSDLLSGQQENDTLKGGRGKDVLLGGHGRDRLFGDAHPDTLMGGPGRDHLDGGQGFDKLEGGSGMDVFVFAKGTGRDTILDFQDNIDTILVDRALSGTLNRDQFLETHAQETGAAIKISIGSDVLRVIGAESVDALRNDLTFVDLA